MILQYSLHILHTSFARLTGQTILTNNQNNAATRLKELKHKKIKKICLLYENNNQNNKYKNIKYRVLKLSKNNKEKNIEQQNGISFENY